VAIVHITLRSSSLSRSVTSSTALPLEISEVNKDMSRILLRHEGGTIGAGKTLAIQGKNAYTNLGVTGMVTAILS